MQGILTSSMVHCHDYWHDHIGEKNPPIQSLRVLLFFVVVLNGKSRRRNFLIFHFLYNAMSLFQILKVTNIINRPTVRLDVHDLPTYFKRPSSVDEALYEFPVKSHQINYYTFAIYIKEIFQKISGSIQDTYCLSMSIYRVET